MRSESRGQGAQRESSSVWGQHTCVSESHSLERVSPLPSQAWGLRSSPAQLSQGLFDWALKTPQMSGQSRSLHNKHSRHCHLAKAPWMGPTSSSQSHSCSVAQLHRPGKEGQQKARPEGRQQPTCQGMSSAGRPAQPAPSRAPGRALEDDPSMQSLATQVRDAGWVSKLVTHFYPATAAINTSTHNTHGIPTPS